ncbi:unnamed protein product [Effrenium voratum]|nr:unnamed protein product [Effrenium voratum]
MALELPMEHIGHGIRRFNSTPRHHDTVAPLFSEAGRFVDLCVARRRLCLLRRCFAKHGLLPHGQMRVQQALIKQRFQRPRVREPLLPAKATRADLGRNRWALEDVAKGPEVALLRGLSEHTFSSGLVPAERGDASLALDQLGSEALGDAGLRLAERLAERCRQHARRIFSAELRLEQGLLARLQRPPAADLAQNPLGAQRGYGYWAPHVDQANVKDYDISAILYLSTFQEHFNGGEFAFNDEDADSCTINWFREWPAEALYSVAKQQLSVNQVQLPNFEGSVKLFQVMHMSVETASKQFLDRNKRHVYITPTSYLELLNSFINVLSTKRKQVGTQQKRYKVGLEKIGDAEAQVSGLQQTLVEKKPVLEKTQKEVEEMMKVIEVDKAAAQEVSTKVAKEEAEAKAKAQATQAIKDDAQKDLDEALPALDTAVACLKKLKADHIREVKVLPNPPAGVRLACEAVCVMFQLKPVKKNDPNTPGKKIDDFWETSQKEILQDAKALLDRLFNFDKDNIPDKVIQTITPYMEREDFDPAAIKKASVACEALCLWVGAMYKYHFVAKAVEPKRQLLREAEADLAECMAKLEAAQEALREVHDKIKKLEADYHAGIAKQESLQHDMAVCEIKLERAHKLIGGLGGEKARWGDNVVKLTEQLQLLPGDCIIAAGMVSYAGPFTSEYRANFEHEWLKELDKEFIAHNEECNMRSVLGEPVKIQQWVVYSLPNDALSIENAIIIDRSRRWPLMIDPQRQANKYIKNMGKDIETGFDVCKMSETNFLRVLELGIQFGKWILLENIGLSLDPALEPILQQQKVRDGSGYTIKLGDKSINYADTFKFFLTTTLPNPHYSPETSVKVTLLNFAITPTGLEDQMLGIVVAKERPDLEEQKSQLVKDNAKMNFQLKEIEDEILHLLSASEGDVLEDDTLVDKVTASKSVSLEISEKQEVAKVTEVDIDNARESYRPVAYRTAVLFFGIVELANIDPMYQYSLQWFQQLFQLAVDQSPKADVLEERLEILQDFFTESLYQNVCRGLFEKDKTLFSFALCIRIMKGDKRVDDAELRYLLVGPTADLLEQGPAMPAEWVGPQRWNEILTVSKLPAFKGFANFMASNLEEFKQIYDSVEAEKATGRNTMENSVVASAKANHLAA